MADKTGATRLRQAIDNQSADGEACFALPIGEAYAICDEVEDELARVSWAQGIPAPVDADGEAVPLTTEVMYDKDGREYKGSSYRSFIWSRERGRWYFGVSEGSREVASLHLSRPDSWEQLGEDADKGVCDYFGHSLCLKCPGFNHAGHSCDKARAQDIVRRAKALAGRDAKGSTTQPSPHEAKEADRG